MMSKQWSVPFAFFTSTERDTLYALLDTLRTVEDNEWKLVVAGKDRTLSGNGAVEVD